jgi:excisionase family DNA binding protein
MKNLRTFTVAEVCAHTNFPRSRVYRLIHLGKLAVVRDSPRGEMRVLEASLLAYFDQATHGAATQLAEAVDKRTVREAVDRSVQTEYGRQMFG